MSASQVWGDFIVTIGGAYYGCLLIWEQWGLLTIPFIPSSSTARTSLCASTVLCLGVATRGADWGEAADVQGLVALGV